jgi:hypothetical protein
VWQVTNLGSVDASGVLFITHLPAPVKIQSISSTPGGFCSQSPAFANSIRLACAINTLPAGQRWSINVSVVSSTNVAKIAALVQFRGTDPVPANNYYLFTLESGSSGGGNSNQVPIRPPAPAPQPPGLNGLIDVIEAARRILD